MAFAKVLFIELAISNKVRKVCDIVEKLFNDGKKVNIYFNNLNDAKTVDRQLWIWKPEPFIPHKIFNFETQDSIEPVLLFTRSDITEKADVLLLFDPLPIEFFESYSLVIDFAELYDTQKLQESRQRFKVVRDTGRYELEFIKLGAFLGMDSKLSNYAL